jgi:hypothetical protein
MGRTMLQLHPIAVRMLALLVLLAALGVAATAYAGSAGRAQDRARDRAAVSNVAVGAAAAEAWFQDPLGGGGSYRKLDAAGLIRQAPAVSSNVHVTVLAKGSAFCLDDEEAAGHSAYFVGGALGRLHHLGGAVPERATLVHSTTADAAAVCRSLS